jgi:FixJ family two-component response regulator
MYRAAPDQYDLIILDMTMPKLSGEELAKEIYAINPDAPVIMCSGYPDSAVRNKIHVLGIKTFLQKPYQMRTLAKAIQQALSPSRSGGSVTSGSLDRKADAPTS